MSLLIMLAGAGLFFLEMGQLPPGWEMYDHPSTFLAKVGAGLVFLGCWLALATLFLLPKREQKS